MSARVSKSEAVEQVLLAAIKFGAAADSVTDGAAQDLGINRTDMRVLAMLRTRGSLSVGGVAQHTGLSPAAATTVVRRLVGAGYAEQASDPEDGRRTLVSLTPTAVARLGEIYQPMLDRGRVWLHGLNLDKLDLLEAFLSVAESLQLDLAGNLRAAKLRPRSVAPAPSSTRSRPKHR